MTDFDLIKEYLRDAYNAGALDLGTEKKLLEGFIRIFAGERESIQAVMHATYLDENEQMKLLPLASVTPESATHYSAWLNRIHNSN